MIQVYEGDGEVPKAVRRLIAVRAGRCYVTPRNEGGRQEVDLRIIWGSTQAMHESLLKLDGASNPDDPVDFVFYAEHVKTEIYDAHYVGHRSSNLNACVVTIAYRDSGCVRTEQVADAPR